MSRAASRQDYDFGPFDDDYKGFQPQEGEGARGPLILALAIGILLIFGAIIWNTYKQGVREDAGALPVILADTTPYKTAPAEPGGLAAPDQERRIYDQIDGSVRTVPNGPVEPRGAALNGGPPVELRPGQEQEIRAPEETSGAALAPVAPPTAQTDAPLSVDVPAAPPTPPVAAPAPAAQFAFSKSGTFLVQIAALRSQEAADAAWASAIAKDPALFVGAEKRVQRADLGAKGVFYRLRVGAFEARDAAATFCDALKAQGKTCIVVSG